MKKGILIALVVVGVLSLAAVGVEKADTPDGQARFPRVRNAIGQLGPLGEFLGLTPDEMQAAREEGKTVADLAEEQGIDLDDLISELITTQPPSIEQRIAKAVENGALTQQEADEKLAQLREGLAERFSTLPDRSQKPGGQARPQGRMALGALGDILDIEPRELLAALQDGQTAAELIEAQGLDVDEVIAELSEPVIERLNQAVQDEKLTQEEADDKLATFQEKLEARLTTPMDEWPEPETPMPQGKGGRQDMGGRKGMGGQRGQAPAPELDSES